MVNGFNSLKEIEKLLSKYRCVDIAYCTEYKYLVDIGKCLRALDFIKQFCIIADYKTEDPNTRYELAFCRKVNLTEEDYELLKGVL